MIDPGVWTQNTTNGMPVIDTTRHHSGASSMHVSTASSNDVDATIIHTVDDPDGYYVRAFVYVETAPAPEMLLGASAMNPSDYAQVWTSDTGGFNLQGGGALQDIDSTAFGRVPLTTWICIEFAVGTMASGGEREFAMSLDGKLQMMTTISASTATADVELGLYRNGGATVQTDAWFDDVEVDTQPIGCD